MLLRGYKGVTPDTFHVKAWQTSEEVIGVGSPNA